MLTRIGVNICQTVRKASQKSQKPTTNIVTKPFVYNRNPRNLEQLRLQRKPTGYGVDNKDVEFWNRLELSATREAVTAKLIHNTNKVVIEASTKEWALRKLLYSGRDKQAYVTLARVFAERCLECGFHSIKCEKSQNEMSNHTAFLKTLEEEGIILEELPYFNIYDIWIKRREKKPWTVLD